MSAPSPCRLAICDDARELVDLLELVLSLEPDLEVVGVAGDGVEVVDMCARVRPDVLLLDVAMPERDGVDALPHVLEASPDTRVIMFTGFASDTVAAKARAAGARDVLLKGIAPAELAAHVRRIHAEPA